MMKVCVIQVDTRPSRLQPHVRCYPGGATIDEQMQSYNAANTMPARDFWCVTPLLNSYHCRKLGWDYRYVHVADPKERHPAWVQIRHLLDVWDSLEENCVMVVLDSDAWIRDAEGFEHVLRTRLVGECTWLSVEDQKVREVVDEGAEAINSGVFAFRPTSRARQFLQECWDMPEREQELQRFMHQWPWEQAIMCRCVRADVAGCSGWMHILPATYCNTPAGVLVSHCWFKQYCAGLATDDLLCTLARDLLPAELRPTTELVVARYQEDVSWLLDWLPLFDRVTVYDKSDSPLLSPHPKVTVVPLKNEGREAHTYAHHFTERYADLCDNVVCSQGSYAEHMSREEFDGLLRGKDRSVMALDIPWHTTVMAHCKWTCDDNHRTLHPPGRITPAGMTLGKYYLQHIADDLVPESQIQFWPGAIFRVSAADVRRHPVSRYAAIRATLEGSINPETGYYVERFWKALFDAPRV
jgi:hypothetical protein